MVDDLTECAATVNKFLSFAQQPGPRLSQTIEGPFLPAPFFERGREVCVVAFFLFFFFLRKLGAFSRPRCDPHGSACGNGPGRG